MRHLAAIGETPEEVFQSENGIRDGSKAAQQPEDSPKWEGEDPIPTERVMEASGFSTSPGETAGVFAVALAQHASAQLQQVTLCLSSCKRVSETGMKQVS